MSRIYIGNLPLDIRESELDDLFYKYGKMREIDLKTPARPPAFAFISYEHYRDAEDAVRGRDGYNFDGYRLRVEFAKGERGGGGRGGGYERGGDRGGPPRRGGGGGGRRTEYGVIVSNLPRGCSWQDLKDYMRKAGDVVYSNIERDGEGIVEFSNRDDMEYAVKSMDDTEFRGFGDSTSYIRVKFAKAPRHDDDDRGGGSSSSGGGGGSYRDRSRSRDRGDDDSGAGGGGRRGRDDEDDEEEEQEQEGARKEEEEEGRGRDDDEDASAPEPATGGDDDKKDGDGDEEED
eukprot:CAMPEP_0174968376 /NCGR_PEP_ID=MMETSP0004_2-20121128/8098_1 /TAXON_ID=420556 /ORGANISM="Ochromonas sp., Strain CCMP1393" /LENGTH=288 /DNA_ID=CAMNT_0016217599 /DNA_START=56 /DNA_END=922 /DNA_ORIENTATION=-